MKTIIIVFLVFFISNCIFCKNEVKKNKVDINQINIDQSNDYDYIFKERIEKEPA